MYSPQQEIFTLCRQKAIEVIGHDKVYDYLPGTVNYPFFFIGEAFSQDKANKTAVFGKVQQTIHLYHNDYKKRGTFEKLIVDLKTKLREVNSTPHFFVSILAITSRILPDNAVGTPLLHGVIEVEFRFY